MLEEEMGRTPYCFIIVIYYFKNVYHDDLVISRMK